MSRRLQENIVILFLLAFFVVVLVTSLGYGPRTRLVPVPIAALAIALIVFQFIWQNFRAADDLNVDLLEVLTGRGEKSDAGPADGPAQQPGAAAPAEWQRIVIAFAMVAVFVAMTLAIGPIPTIFLFTGAYLKLSGHFRLGKATLYAALFTLATYLMFVQVLHLQLYHGYLEPLADFLRRLTRMG